MFNSITNYVNSSIESLKSKFNTFSSIPNGKVLTESEEKKLKSEILATKYAVEKCSKGHIFPVETKKFIKEFEKAGYELKKLPPNIAANLNSTYKDLKEAASSGQLPSNSAAQLYCEIYENLANNNFKNYIDRVKSSKFFQKSKFSKESFNGIESLEEYIISNGFEMSEEGVSSFLAGVGTKIMYNSGVTGTLGTINNALTTLNYLLIVIGVIIIIALLIHSLYISEFAKLQRSLSETTVKNSNEIDKQKDTLKLRAAQNIDANAPVFTKNFLFKPAIFVNNAMSKMGQFNYSTFDKGLSAIEKAAAGKEEFDLREFEFSSEEAVTAAAGAGAAAATSWFSGTFLAGLSPILGVSFVILLIIMIIPLSRAMVYYIHHARIELSGFFEEQAAWVKNNYGTLEEQLNNPNLPEVERQRIEKIIQKQKNWYTNLISLSERLYKKQIEAGQKARDEIRMEEKIDFGKIVDQIEDKNTEDSPTITDNDVPDPINKPKKEPPQQVIIF